MKKFLLIPAMALMALASCSKSELLIPDQEISFQTVTSPATKALGATQVAFSTSNHFYSYAYLLTESKTWDVNAAAAQLYFGPVDISYQTDKWKNATTTYLWPKDANSSLTFFAWTDNTNAPVSSIATCSTTDGIAFANVDITNASYKNKDFMVADIMKDQKKNDDADEILKEGVATVFRHKLSNFEFWAKTKSDYTGVDIKITSIKFSTVNTTASYKQLPAASEGWTFPSPSVTGTTPMYTPTTPVKLTDEYVQQMPVATDFSILLPQDVPSGATSFEIKYTITTNYTGSAITETVTETKALNAIYDTSAKWEMGKKYKLNITIGLDEILWDPAVEDWTLVTEEYITPAV